MSEKQKIFIQKQCDIEENVWVEEDSNYLIKLHKFFNKIYIIKFVKIFNYITSLQLFIH